LTKPGQLLTGSQNPKSIFSLPLPLLNYATQKREAQLPAGHGGRKGRGWRCRRWAHPGRLPFLLSFTPPPFSLLTATPEDERRRQPPKVARKRCAWRRHGAHRRRTRSPVAKRAAVDWPHDDALLTSLSRARARWRGRAPASRRWRISSHATTGLRPARRRWTRLLGRSASLPSFRVRVYV
jgi:hypothetical protein